MANTCHFKIASLILLNIIQDKRKNMGGHYNSANLHHMQLLMMRIHQQGDLIVNQQTQLTQITEQCQQMSVVNEQQQRLAHVHVIYMTSLSSRLLTDTSRNAFKNIDLDQINM